MSARTLSLADVSHALGIAIDQEQLALELARPVCFDDGDTLPAPGDRQSVQLFVHHARCLALAARIRFECQPLASVAQPLRVTRCGSLAKARTASYFASRASLWSGARRELTAALSRAFAGSPSASNTPVRIGSPPEVTRIVLIAA